MALFCYDKGVLEAANNRGQIMQNLSYKVDGQKIFINCATSSFELTVLTPEIIRVFRNHGCTQNSYAIEGDKVQETDFEITENRDHMELKTSALIVNIFADGKIDVYDKDKNPLILDYRHARQPLDRQMSEDQKRLAEQEGHDVSGNLLNSPTYFEVVKKLADDEVFYGLGDKTGFLNKRHYAYDNWNTDNPAPQVENFTRLYKSVPFLLGLKNQHPYGIFFDNTYKSHIDLGKESNNYYFYSAANGNLDYYIIGGASLKKVVENYTYLTGKTPLPQKWTLGYQQSRWGYSVSQEKVLQIAEKLREYDLPCDVIHLDIDYMDGYRVFTWRTDTYEDPREFVSKLKNMGFKVVTIIDPGVKKDDQYGIYQEGLAKGYFVQNPDGTIYVNRVWPGDAVYPDFGRKQVRKWWADNCRYLVDIGVSGIWDDMNEPASFNGDIPEDIVFSDEENKSTHAKMHNVYGHNMAKATYEGLKRYSHKRPFVITRAAYAGTQKYSTIWTGDNHSLWVHLQMMIAQLCNLGLSGFSFAGTDIGGFGSDTTPELLTRWIEGALFSPLFRNHSALGTRSQEPWSFGEPTLSIYRKYLKLRYRFIDYLYDQFYQENKTGLPIMRPLVLNYENDPQVYNLNDEYLVGDSILVAPVIQQGKTKRMVYLPAGKWIDFWDKTEYEGQTTILVDAPIDKLPIFIKKNTILPWSKEVDHISTEPQKEITFKLYGDHTSYQHYQDNGTDFSYENGKYNLYDLNVGSESIDINLLHHDYPLYQRTKVELPDKTVEFKLAHDKYVLA